MGAAQTAVVPSAAVLDGARSGLTFQPMSNSVVFLLGVVVGGLVGALVTWIWSSWWDWRTPSAERAFLKAWRCAKRMRLRADELRDIWSVVDMRGDRMLPIVRVIRHEELTLEASTEVIDRLRQRLLNREGSTAGLREYRLGWPRNIVGNRAYPDLDKAVRLPGVVQVGDHATQEAQSPEAQDASVRKEFVEGEKLRAEARAEAEAQIRGERAAADRFPGGGTPAG